MRDSGIFLPAARAFASTTMQAYAVLTTLLQMETIMKLRFADVHLPARFHGPLRFGSRWRGHELLLRACQLIVFAMLAVVGGQLIAQLIRFVVRSFAAT
jgi:hypothetical protein